MSIYPRPKLNPRRSDRTPKPKTFFENNSNRGFTLTTLPTPLLMDRLSHKLRSIQLAASYIPTRSASYSSSSSSSGGGGAINRHHPAAGEGRTKKHNRPMKSKMNNNNIKKPNTMPDATLIPVEASKQSVGARAFQPKDTITAYRYLLNCKSPMISSLSDSSSCNSSGLSIAAMNM